jgi:coenzyme Q-binding protein COQ10
MTRQHFPEENHPFSQRTLDISHHYRRHDSWRWPCLRLWSLIVLIDPYRDLYFVEMAVRRPLAASLASPLRPMQNSGPSTIRIATQQNRTLFDSLLSSALGSCETRSMSHSKVLPYSATAVFKAVSDVAGYPNFLPFTISSTVKARDQAGYPTRASLKVGYSQLGVEETWESLVRCDPAMGTIEAKSSDAHSDGLFELLSTKWHIVPSKAAQSSTAVKLDVNVKFKNPIYDQMFAQIEGKVASHMISAFEKRVEELERTKKVPS